jgi:hypothetical protein
MKPVNEPIHRLPSCTQCGNPAVSPHAVKFLGMWFDKPICRERWREALRERDGARKADTDWMQKLKRKAE